MIAGKPMATNAATAASDTSTRGRCFSVYLFRSKCHSAQWPTEAKTLSGEPRKNLKMLAVDSSHFCAFRFVFSFHSLGFGVV